MPQNRASGADADRYGRETSRKIAVAIGAKSISENSNEFEMDKQKVTIRCARKNTQTLGAPYQLLERVDAVIAALEQDSGDYKLYRITPDKIKNNMRPTESKGSSAGRVGLVRKSVFINAGEFIRDVKLNSGTKNKTWRMAFRCGNKGYSLWPECKKYNVAAIAYDPIAIDLTHNKYNDPHSAWDKLLPSQKSSLRHLAYEMKAGDTIYVKEGTQIICKGTVQGNADRAYIFDNSYRIIEPKGNPWPHQVPVKWDISFAPVNILLGAEQNAVLELTGDRLKKLQAALIGYKAAAEDKIARISWNTEGWKFPSGPLGKSTNPDAYEAKHGYGHEEWLFDRSRIIDGYHYAFLEPLNVESGKHFGKLYNISLFTINGSGTKLYVGKIKNAICVSKDEAEDVYNTYDKNGWIQEMAGDIRRVGIDSAAFLKNLPRYIFNIKFKFEDVTELEELEEISKKDANITTSRFRLLSKKKDFIINEVADEDESEGEYRNEAKRKAVFKKEVEYDPCHSIMQNVLKKILQDSYKDEYEKVCIETGRIDIKARTKAKKWHYFEIKTNTPKNCIRAALGQIMEYAYWPNNERAERLIIVGQNPLDDNGILYMKYIREKFKIPVYYRNLDIGKEILSKDS